MNGILFVVVIHLAVQVIVHSRILQPVCSKNGVVCGTDGKNYQDGCQARKGVDVACRKPCPCSPCICTKEYLPVCGVDGKSYDNACMARCANVAIKCNGPCPCNVGCVCTLEYAPVCGSDGKKYSNKCFSGCAGVTVECKHECPCPSLS